MIWQIIENEIDIRKMSDTDKRNIIIKTLNIAPELLFSIAFIHKKYEDISNIVKNEENDIKVIETIKEKYEHIYNDLFFVCLVLNISNFLSQLGKEVKK